MKREGNGRTNRQTWRGRYGLKGDRQIRRKQGKEEMPLLKSMWTWHLRPKAQVQIIEFAHNHQTLKELPPLRSPPPHKSSFAFLLYLLLSIFACLAVHHSLISLITSLSSPLTFFSFFLKTIVSHHKSSLTCRQREVWTGWRNVCLNPCFFPRGQERQLYIECWLFTLETNIFVRLLRLCQHVCDLRDGYKSKAWVNNLFLRETSLLW